MKRTLLILGVVVVAVILLAAWLAWGPAYSPAGQPALVSLEPGNFNQLQEAFNSDADKIRVVALLSPT